MVGSSFVEVLDDLYCVAGTVCHAQGTSASVMDSLYFLGSQVCELVAVITFPTEFHSCDSFNFVGLLEDDHQFTYDVVDAWGHFSEADHISPDL